MNNSPSLTNSKEELEFYKLNFHKKEEELSKCMKKIKILEKLNKNLLQKFNAGTFSKISKNIINTNNKDNNKQVNILKDNNINFKNKNNNRKNYKEISRNEFKNLWESIIQTELIDNFDFCINEYLLISYLCQDIILLVYNESQNEILSKFNQVLKCLNLDKICKSKYQTIYEEFVPFLREYINNIFIFQSSFLNNIHKKLIAIIKEYNYNKLKVKNNISSLKYSNRKNNNINNFNIEIPILLEKKINEGHFDSLIKSFYKICIYMILHEPILSFNIDEHRERNPIFNYYNKNNYINVEGFGNDSSPCILLLPPPLLKNKFPFNGLRAAVYIINESDNNIYSECELNKSKIKDKENNEYLDDKNEEIYSKKKDNDKSNSIKKNIKQNRTNNIINNNVILKNKKNEKNENEFKIETFNLKLGFNSNNSKNNDIQGNKKDKLLLSNSFGNIINQNHKENNNYNGKINFNRKYKNKKISKEKTNIKKSYIPNMNFISIKQISKNNKIILNQGKTDNFFHNFKNDYIEINSQENKTPDIYRPLQRFLRINEDNIINNKDERYEDSNLIEKNINFYKKINKEINHRNSFSNIINPENYLKQYYSDFKLNDRNMRNTSFYISKNYKPFRKSINKNLSLENITNNSSNFYDEDFNYNKHSYNTIVLNSLNNISYDHYPNYDNINNSNNFKEIKRNNIININQNKYKNIDNVKLHKRNNNLQYKNIIQNGENIKVFNLKNSNENFKTSEINRNSQYTNKNRLLNITNNRNNNIRKREEIFKDKNNFHKLNNKNIINTKSKEEGINIIKKQFINNKDINYKYNNEKLFNSFNGISYLNNLKNESKTIDNDKYINKRYMNINTSYKNLFYNDGKNYEIVKINNNKNINYSNLFDSNNDINDYNIVYQQKIKNNIDNKKGGKISNYYNMKKLLIIK